MSAFDTGSRVTAILTAMPEEAAPLRAQLRDVRRLGPKGWPTLGSTLNAALNMTMVQGVLGQRRVVLAVTGDGEHNARVQATQLFAACAAAKLHVDRLLVLGVAGALTPSLRVDDLIVADEVLSERGRSEGDGEQSLLSDRPWTELAVRHSSAVRGIVLSGSAIADTRAYKQRLLALTHAHTRDSNGNSREPARPAVVDLESFTYATLAQSRGIPWMVLRAVSDTAEETLPGLLNRCRDDGGAVKRSRVVRALITDPRPLPQLLRLGRRVSRSSILLAQAAALILSLAPPPAADENTLLGAS